jgi:hypothetical protein
MNTQDTEDTTNTLVVDTETDSDLALTERQLEAVRKHRKEAQAYRLKELEARDALRNIEKTHAEKLASAVAEAKSEAKLAAQKEIALARLEAIAVKAGITDPDDLSLLDQSTLEYDENGKIKNAAEAIESFKTKKPHLFGSSVATASTFKAPPKTDPTSNSASDLSAEAWAAEKKRLGI